MPRRAPLLPSVCRRGLGHTSCRRGVMSPLQLRSGSPPPYFWQHRPDTAKYGRVGRAGRVQGYRRARADRVWATTPGGAGGESPGCACPRVAVWRRGGTRVLSRPVQQLQLRRRGRVLRARHGLSAVPLCGPFHRKTRHRQPRRIYRQGNYLHRSNNYRLLSILKVIEHVRRLFISRLRAILE